MGALLFSESNKDNNSSLFCSYSFGNSWIIEKTKEDYCIIEFKGKYLGIVGVNFLMSDKYEY